MEYNENENREIDDSDFFKKENNSLKEKNKGNSSIWYWIIAILILGLFGWYGYTVGWFTKDVNTSYNLNQKIDNKTPFASSDNKAQVSNVLIDTSNDFPVKKTLVVKGNLENNCAYLNDPQVIRDGSTFYVSLTTREEGDACVDGLVPYESDIDLEVLGLPAGVYTVDINGIQTNFELEQDNSVDFSSGEEK